MVSWLSGLITRLGDESNFPFVVRDGQASPHLRIFMIRFHWRKLRLKQHLDLASVAIPRRLAAKRSLRLRKFVVSLCYWVPVSINSDNFLFRASLEFKFKLKRNITLLLMGVACYFWLIQLRCFASTVSALQNSYPCLSESLDAAFFYWKWCQQP